MNKLDVLNTSEELVFNWLSFTRGISLSKRKNILKKMIITKLLSQSVEPIIADRLAESSIFKWSNECSGLSLDHPMVIDSLIRRVYDVLK